jgi:hypothetical protein
LKAAGLGSTLDPNSRVGFPGRNLDARPIHHPACRDRTVPVWKRNTRLKAVQHLVELARETG